MAGDFGFGTLLKMGSTPVTVAQVTSVSGPGYELETVDVTAHDSSTSYYREYIAGLLDAGEVSMDLNFDPDGATHKNSAGGLLYTMEQRTLENWQIVYPDATAVAFVAFVTSFEPDAPFDDKLSASVTLKISGKPTWTYA
jgi:predicted secreted protein